MECKYAQLLCSAFMPPTTTTDFLKFPYMEIDDLKQQKDKAGKRLSTSHFTFPTSHSLLYSVWCSAESIMVSALNFMQLC